MNYNGLSYARFHKFELKLQITSWYKLRLYKPQNFTNKYKWNNHNAKSRLVTKSPKHARNLHKSIARSGFDKNKRINSHLVGWADLDLPRVSQIELCPQFWSEEGYPFQQLCIYQSQESIQINETSKVEIEGLEVTIFTQKQKIALHQRTVLPSQTAIWIASPDSRVVINFNEGLLKYT